MTALAYNTATIGVLWRRDMLRFLRQPSRIVGALGQPIIFWLLIGSGMASTFKVPGLDTGYMEYFFPGVVVMILLFASIFASVSVINDRHEGFLQAVIAGPGSDTALVLGKCFGAATVALLQAGLFVLLAPLAGFALTEIQWPILLAAMTLGSLALTALGFAAAWWLDNVQAYHAVQMTLLVPLWVLSGAMFPSPTQKPYFAAVMAANPIAYLIDATRHSMYGGTAPAGLAVSSDPMMSLAIVGLFAVASVALATRVCRRRQ